MRAVVCLLLLCAGYSYPQTGNPRGRRGGSPSTPNTPLYQAPPVTFRGKLKLMSGKEIVLDSDDGAVVSVRRTRKTKFLKDSKPIKASDIPVGAPLMLDVIEGGDLKPEAVDVIMNPPPEKAPEK